MSVKRDTRIRLSAADVVAYLAERHGATITLTSWHTYTARNPEKAKGLVVGPKPDGHFGRTPYWHPTTVDAWWKSRPGQGAGGGRPRKTPTVGIE